ncbi:MAG: amino acid permease [Myxococcota bacterium]|nr:amino acid permease [Myxococcota bacterium]
MSGESVSYQEKDAAWFEERRLRRHAGVGSLWALGVGAVISGDFFGWNFGLTVGGFGGLLIATVIATLLYAGLCMSIAELAAALPHAGGAYSFGRTAFGPWGGFVVGLAANIEYVLTPAVIVVGIGGYLGAVFETPPAAAPLWWLGAYALFVGLNVRGVELTFRVAIATTVLALVVLLFFYALALPSFSWEMALAVEPDPGQSRFLPRGGLGVLWALPFAMWFFLAVEELPLAAEEARDPVRDLPRALRWALWTLVATAFLMLFANAGLAPGAAEVGASDEPLFLGFRAIFGDATPAKLLALIAVSGLIASFHSIIYAYGRNIYALSRAGYFPHWLSRTNGVHQTPHVALVVGASIGFVVALAIEYSDAVFGSVPVGAVLLNMAVFGALVSYLIQAASFLELRRRFPELERPYRSRFGRAGAVVALGLSALTLVFLFLNPEYRAGVWGCAVWYALGLAYFALRGRHQLVRSPEEDAAEQVRRGPAPASSPDREAP